MKLSLVVVGFAAVVSLVLLDGCRDEPGDAGAGVRANPDSTEPGGAAGSDVKGDAAVVDASAGLAQGAATCGANITLFDVGAEVRVERGSLVPPNLAGGTVSSGRYSLVRDVLFGMQPSTLPMVSRRGALMVDDDAKGFTLRLTFPNDEIRTGYTKFKSVMFGDPSVPDSFKPMLIVWPVCALSTSSSAPEFVTGNQLDPPIGPSTEIPFEVRGDSLTFILPTPEGDELLRFERR